MKQETKKKTTPQNKMVRIRVDVHKAAKIFAAEHDTTIGEFLSDLADTFLASQPKETKKPKIK